MATIKAHITVHDICEGYDVETASQMVDAMQSSQVGVVYLALTVAPATEGKSSVSRKVNDNTYVL